MLEKDKMVSYTNQADINSNNSYNNNNVALTALPHIQNLGTYNA